MSPVTESFPTATQPDTAAVRLWQIMEALEGSDSPPSDQEIEQKRQDDAAILASPAPDRNVPAISSLSEAMQRLHRIVMAHGKTVPKLLGVYARMLRAIALFSSEVTTRKETEEGVPVCNVELSEVEQRQPDILAKYLEVGRAYLALGPSSRVRMGALASLIGRDRTTLQRSLYPDEKRVTPRAVVLARFIDVIGASIQEFLEIETQDLVQRLEEAAEAEYQRQHHSSPEEVSHKPAGTCTLRREQRDEKILLQHAQGQTAASIARILGVSAPTVYSVIRKSKERTAGPIEPSVDEHDSE
ncbi:MAG: helix-turn-helix domain-containing protein [Candidatus Peregrinibacteria bacterium]